MRDEAVVARITHRGIQKPVDEQRARVLVKLVLDRLTADWNFDDDIDIVGWRVADRYLFDPHRHTVRHRGRAQVFGLTWRRGRTVTVELTRAPMTRRGRCNSPPGWRNLTHQRLQAIGAAAALATIELLDDPRSQPEGEWHDAVASWNGARIRKIVRRGRASAWQRAQVPDGVTVERDGAEVRAFVPSRMDQAPDALAKLQIRSSPLDEIERVGAVPNGGGLFHRGHPARRDVVGQAGSAVRARRAMGVDAVRSGDCARHGKRRDGRSPSSIRHEALWAKLVEDAPVQIHDGGFTEVPAGTKTAVAWWAEPFGH